MTQIEKNLERVVRGKGCFVRICEICVLCGFVFGFQNSAAHAQPVPSREPSSTHIFPAGGRRGTAQSVLVGAECVPPGTNFRIWGDGVTANTVLGPKVQAALEPSPRRDPREIPISYPKEWESKIEITADASLGQKTWRLTCARGGTGTRPFIVGDLPEFIETESNSVPERAERICLPVTVNGRIAGESDLDYFIFAARQDDVVLCDVVAGRIGSPLDPVVAIEDVAGRRLEVEEARVGTDPILAFRAPASGDYRLLVSNVSFHGSPAYVYRITLTATHDLPPTDTHGLMSQLLARGLVPSISYDEGRSFSPEARKDSAAAATLLTLPAMIDGRFETAKDEDWFRFPAAKDLRLTISCRACPAGFPTLPVIGVLDAEGKVLNECSSAASPDRECWIDWRSPADGEYRLRLRDVQFGVRGGPEFSYRLSVQPTEPDFSLRLASDFANVLQGGRAELVVTARRSGGFTAPIELIVQGLPEGVRVESTQIAANQTATKLVLIADDDARPIDATLRVIGRATTDGRGIERVASAPHLGCDVEGVSLGPPHTEELQLTVQHRPVFRLYCNEAYQYAHRGTIYPYLMQVERIGGFDGPITIQLGDRQNRDLDEIEFIEVTVPPGQTDLKLPIYLPETMHINAFGQSQIYAQGHVIFEDKWGQRQSTLVVSEKRNMIRTLPTVVKLSAVDKQLIARPGTTVVCKLQLDRTTNFTGPMELELITPGPGSGLAAETVRVEANQEQVEVPVQVAETAISATDLTLRFRARGQLSSGATVVTEAAVPVRVK